jgi:intracellular multiplication protein IcmE
MSDRDEFDGDAPEEFDTDLGFDDQATTNSSRNATLMKIGLVAAALVAVVVVVSMLGGSGGDRTPPSQVPGNQAGGVVGPGGETVDPKYQEAIETYNQNKINVAKETGTSVIPVDIGRGDQTLTANSSAFEQQGMTERQRRIEEQYRMEQARLAQQNMAQQDAAQAQARASAIQSMSQSMSSYLTSAVANRQPSGMSEMSIGYQSTSAGGGGYGEQTSGTGVSGGVASSAPATLLPAATIEYGQLMIEANTDAPGPVLAMVVSGKLSGARLLGTFQKTDDYLVLNFNQAVTKDGRALPIQAIALDPDSTLPGMVTEIDRKYFQRYILPAAADFISGVGEALAETQVSVTQTSSSTTTSSNDPDFDEAISQGISDAFDGISDAVKDSGRRTQPMLRIAAGTPVGILFTAPVLDQTTAEKAAEDAAARAQENSMLQSLVPGLTGVP